MDGFGTGLTLGLATGTACLASCGPIYATYLLAEKRTGFQSLWIILKLNAGRFLAYALFGAMVGLLGGSIPVRLRMALAFSGYVLFSLYLFLSVVRVKRTCSGCSNGRFLKLTKSPFLLGILTGFSICPAFLIAVTRAFDSGGPVNGALMFSGFFFGTTVYMLPFALFGLLTVQTWITKAARVLAVIVAVYFLALGIRGFVTWLNMREPYGEETSGSYVFSVEDADTLYILTFGNDMDDKGALLAGDMPADLLPPVVVVEVSGESFGEAVESIPELSAVITPPWVDSRYEAADTEPWQDSLAAMIRKRRFRTFAVEYQPYCLDRARGIESFLHRYDFKIDPDSGFIFLMLNPLACDPLDCSTCGIPH